MLDIEDFEVVTINFTCPTISIYLKQSIFITFIHLVMRISYASILFSRYGIIYSKCFFFTTFATHSAICSFEGLKGINTNEQSIKSRKSTNVSCVPWYGFTSSKQHLVFYLIRAQECKLFFYEEKTCCITHAYSSTCCIHFILN